MVKFKWWLKKHGFIQHLILEKNSRPVPIIKKRDQANDATAKNDPGKNCDTLRIGMYNASTIFPILFLCLRKWEVEISSRPRKS